MINKCHFVCGCRGLICSALLNTCYFRNIEGTAGHPYEQAYIFKNVLIEMFDIVLGRDESEKESLGQEGLVFLGRLYVNMGNTTSLSNNVYLDVAKSHVILVCGKRGCLEGDSLVFTGSGYKKISEFNSGDKVLSFNKDKNSFLWEP